MTFRDGDEVWIGPEWLGVYMDYESKWKPVGDDTVNPDGISTACIDIHCRGDDNIVSFPC